MIIGGGVTGGGGRCRIITKKMNRIILVVKIYPFI